MHSTPKTDAELEAACCEANLPLNEKLGREYFYQSLPLCVIDAVFSIGVRYAGVKKVVSRYCDYFTLPQYRKQETVLPPEETQRLSMPSSTRCAGSEARPSRRKSLITASEPLPETG